jgi:hypothetical protein
MEVRANSAQSRLPDARLTMPPERSCPDVKGAKAVNRGTLMELSNYDCRPAEPGELPVGLAKGPFIPKASPVVVQFQIT